MVNPHEEFLSRLNVRGKLYANNTNVEHIMTNRDRYLDPLIRDKAHNVNVPYDRERNAAEDAVGNKLTWGYAEKAWSEYPKFYEADEVDAPPVMEDWRDFLIAINFKNPARVATALAAIHGWSVTHFWFENGEMNYYIFSEYQCRPEQIQRDWQSNEIIGFRFSTKPLLPLNRPRTNLQDILKEYSIDTPGVIHLTRGDTKMSYGFGYSRFGPCFDQIVKLREESNANALRARVFPIAVVPPNWGKDQVSKFFDKIANMDQTTALATKAGVDAAGNPVPELPAFNYISPGTSASNKSSQGGSGAISDLSSEWSRLCTATSHNVSYFVGAGAISASMAAGEVDKYDDTQSDIDEFSLYDEYITDFIRFVGEGMGQAVPDHFVIKSHWEWARDEERMAMAQAEEQAFELEKDKASASKQNKRIRNSLRYHLRNNMSMPMRPVASSNIKGVGLDEGELLVDFHGKGKKTYAYDYDNPAQALEKWDELINATSKGGWVIDNLKGDKMGPAMGTGKQTLGGTSASLVPYSKTSQTPGTKQGAFGESYDKTSKELRDFKMDEFGEERAYRPEQSGFASKAPSPFHKEEHGYGFPLNKPTQTGAAMQATKPQLRTGKRGRPAKAQHYLKQRETAAKEAQSMLRSLMGKRNESIFTLSPKRLNEIAQELYGSSHGKDTIDKIKQLVAYEQTRQNQSIYRINSMQELTGTAISFDHDLYYENNNGGLDIERACKKDWKKNVVGQTGKVQLYHKNMEYVIGSVVFGWDEEKDIATVNSEIDRNMIKSIMEKNELHDSRLYEKVVNNEPLPISTEYRCDVEIINGTRFQRNFKEINLALVDQGNCPDNICNLQ